MLSRLAIRQFALIKSLELEFASGFSVLSGETGAGKSILLDALQLVLGGRSSAAHLRPGAARAEVSATFDLSDRPGVQAWLADNDLDSEDSQELLLRRVVNADGRSRAYINGSQAPVQTLKTLGDRLVEIHGQHEFQTLVKSTEQRRLVDLYAATQNRLKEVARAFEHWRSLTAELELLRGSVAISPAELELLRHQIDELSAVAVTPEALEQRHAEQRRLAHAEDLIAALGEAVEKLADPINGNLAGITQTLARQQASLSELAEPLDLLNSALVQAQEAEGILQRQLRELEADPGRLAELERELDAIHSLARKHRIEPEDLLPHLDQLKARMSAAEAADGREQELLTALTSAEATFRESAKKLSAERTRGARKLARAVTATIGEVGMAEAKFSVDVAFDADRPPTQDGIDEVIFNIRTNPGSPTGPLDRVASGGELSRVALAIKVALAQMESGRTMIFDEVDAGVGGATAQQVGYKLRQLGASGQVLSVTHLPQVAACGHAHFRVEKDQGKSDTVTRVSHLDPDERLEELSRMLGGVEITEQTRAHAKEMLESAEQG
ncbi:MAG: DNA repair protein RecN [Pseudomonadota bacterium]